MGGSFNMYCYKCGAKNHNDVNFCYNCGANVSHLKKKKNIKTSSNNFLKSFAYNKLVKSKNKYRNAYFLIVSAVLSTFFVTKLSTNFQHVLRYAIKISSMYGSNAPFNFVKAQSELAFRDVWCYIFLAIGFILIIVCDIIIFSYTLRIKSKRK